MFHCFSDIIAICPDAFRRSRVVKFRCISEVAKEQKAVFMAHFHEPVIIFPLVYAFAFLDTTPGKVLPSPLDSGFFHFLQDCFKVRRIGLKGGIDAKGRGRQKVIGKRMWRQCYVKSALCGWKLSRANGSREEKQDE
ncbi:hypothetical protein ES703_110488 [subsurface metagenome]